MDWLNQRGVSIWSSQAACGITPASTWQWPSHKLAWLRTPCCTWHDIGQWMERARISHFSLWDSPLHYHGRVSLPHPHYQNVYHTTWISGSAYVWSGRGLIRRNLEWGLHCSLGVRREIGGTQQKRRLRNGQQGEITVSWRNGTNSSWTRWREI